MIGEVSTGKSALIKRYVHNFFGTGVHYRATLGVDFQLKILRFSDDLDIRLQLWDIAGQERFSSMIRAYYGKAVGAVVCFDHVSFKNGVYKSLKWVPNYFSVRCQNISRGIGQMESGSGFETGTPCARQNLPCYFSLQQNGFTKRSKYAK